MTYSTDQRHGAARAASATHAWIWALVTLGYLLPWAIAASRGLRNSSQIFWLNLLLGWSCIGWIVALVMALGRHQVVPQVIVAPQPPQIVMPTSGPVMGGGPSPAETGSATPSNDPPASESPPTGPPPSSS